MRRTSTSSHRQESQSVLPKHQLLMVLGSLLLIELAQVNSYILTNPKEACISTLSARVEGIIQVSWVI